ncbi:hypothetical protein QFZ20_003263 [Flavobacterium sp. W4I14]|nr:hypothetical protein [Flavobacterium sp. W4I14]
MFKINLNFMRRQTYVIKRNMTDHDFLMRIRIGDLLVDESGKKGRVIAIDRYNRIGEVHYYFRRDKGGTVLCII